MRPRKLSKSTKLKSNGMPDAFDEAPDLTFKASINDLRSSESRQSLRQNFIGAFPETRLRPSLESVSDDIEMPDKDGMSRSKLNGASRHEKSGTSSSSSTSKNSVEVQRLPTVAETKAKMDIGAVISLLQDLRSTASPAELVALHKALLPTRDSVVYAAGTPPSFDDPMSPVSPLSFVRQRAMLPPAVATRSASEELPRMPEDPVSPLSTSRPRTEPASRKDLAALDLMDDPSFATKLRSPSPNQHENTFMGAYRPGTLRITNGTASPEPGALCRSVEASSAVPGERKGADVFETAPSTPCDRDTFRVAYSNSPSDLRQRSNLAFETKRQNEDRTSSNKLYTGSKGFATSRRASEPVSWSASTLNETQPQLSKAAYSEDTRTSNDRYRDRSQSYADEVRNPTLAQALPRLDTSVSKPVRDSSKQSSQRSSRTTSKQSLMPDQHGTENGGGSPPRNNSLPFIDRQVTSDVPRFVQRWSHRLSHIPHDQGLESQQTSDLREEKNNSQNLSNRLSTVTDMTTLSQEEKPNASVETPEVALAKLNGHVGHRLFNQPKSKAGDSKSSAISSSEAALEEPEGVPQPKTLDSSYGSEASHPTDGRKQTNEVPRIRENDLGDVTEQPHKAYKGVAFDDDELSLYSFKQVLSSPSLLSGLASPSPPSARGSMKHLSLLGLATAQSTGRVDAQYLNLPGSANRLNSQASLEHKVSTPPKKLQKQKRGSIMKSFRLPSKQDKRLSKISSLAYVPDDLEDAYLGHLNVAAPARTASKSTAFNQLADVQSNLAQPMPRNNKSSHDIAGDPPHYQEVSISSSAARPRHGNFPYNPKYLVNEKLVAGDECFPRPREVNGLDNQRESTAPKARPADAPSTPCATAKLPKGVRAIASAANEDSAKMLLDFDQTGSIADVVRKAAEARKVQERGPAKASRPADGSLVAGALDSKSKKKAKKTQRREEYEVDGTAIAELECSQSLALSNRPGNEESRWKSHAKAERQLHKAIVETFRKGSTADERHELSLTDESSKSPDIVVSEQTAPDAVGEVEIADTTLEPANSDESLAGTDEPKELVKIPKKSTHGDFAWRESTATFVTVSHCKEENATTHDERVDSALSVKSYPSDTSSTERSWGSTVTSSGNGLSTKIAAATEEKQVEHSRAESLAKLTGAADGSEASLQSARCSLHTPHDSLDSLINRYSAGLPYGWSAGRNFRDSTGVCPC